MKLRFLKSDVVKMLYDKVPVNLENYRKGNFDFLTQDLTLTFEGKADVDFDQLALIRREGKDLREVENCELMQQAMGGLTPYVARDERIWVFLTHTLLLSYTRERWPEAVSDDDEVAIKNVRAHFFGKGNRGIERDNSASRLWWMAHLCQRVEGMSLHDSLTCFLYKTDVRANIVERPTTSQSVKVFSAVIKKLNASLQDDQALFERSVFRPFMTKLNLRGGVQLLDTLSYDDLEKVLEKCI